MTNNCKICKSSNIKQILGTSYKCESCGDHFTIYDHPLAEPNIVHVSIEKAENVNHPKHYNAHPSGIECIDVGEHMSFNLGNAVKYIWRCDLKKDAIEEIFFRDSQCNLAFV